MTSSYVEVIPRLVAAGRRVIVPYLRGHGPTRFVDTAAPRSGQQAAIGADVIALLNALSIPHAVFAGYDWGGRAACVAAALWPERSDRGRAGLTANRREIAQVIWTRNSPTWAFDDATLRRAAVAFDNPDYVDVVLHSYRHRLGFAPSHPPYEEIEQRLATL